MATFRGRHNEVKAKCFLLMYQYPSQSFTRRQLVRILGISDASLQVLLIRWTRWKYVLRKMGKFNTYSYKLGCLGRQWLEKNKDWMPIERYLAEINAHQAKLR